jgi:hypothetical protein
MYSLKKKHNKQILGKTHILNDQVFTKSTTNQLYCRKKEWKEKQNKKWMVLFITYLRPSLQKKKKNKAMKSTKQNAVKADYYHWLAIPICFGL